MVRWQSWPGPPTFPMPHVWTGTLFTAGAQRTRRLFRANLKGFGLETKAEEQILFSIYNFLASIQFYNLSLTQ